MGHIRSVRELDVYPTAFDAAMEVFQVTKKFPDDERYSMTDQFRRATRSVCTNLAEAWRKRKYPAHFVSKLTDAESEAEEARVWLQFALRCGYMTESVVAPLDDRYDKILGQLVRMGSEPDDWTIR